MRDTLYQALDRIPKHITDNYPRFEEFITKYYQWFEENYGNKTDFLRIRNIDETDESFIEYFINDLAPGFPTFIGNDNPDRSLDVKKDFVKHAKEFFKTKGTEEAIYLFFKLLFNDNVSIYYPRDDIFSSSESTWSELSILKVSSVGIDLSKVAKNVWWFGTSGKLYIDEIQELQTENYIKLFVSNVQGNIEDVTQLRQYKSEFEPGITLTLIKHFTKAEVVTPGYGFANKETFEYSVYDGVTVEVASTTRGSITGITIVDGGSLYNPSTDAINVLGGNGYSAKVTFGVNGSGTINATNIFSGGKMFDSIPSLTLTTVNGTGAELLATSTNIGGIKGINIIESGINTPSTYTISAGSASIKLISGNLLKTAGSFSNFKNFISSKNTVFEEEHFYQMFSYVLKSNVSYSLYENFLKILVHPVGMKGFYQLLVSSSASKELAVIPNTIIKKVLKIFIDVNIQKPKTITAYLEKTIGDSALPHEQISVVDTTYKFMFNSRPISYFKNSKIIDWMDSPNNVARTRKTNIQPDVVINIFEEDSAIGDAVLGQLILGQL